MWDVFWSYGSMTAEWGASRQAAEASSRANSAEMRVRELEHRVERLALACNAMWTLLRDQTGLTDQQLQDKILEIDAADGVAHEKGRNMILCATCGRHVSPRKGKCIYCGAACGDASAFESR